MTLLLRVVVILFHLMSTVEKKIITIKIIIIIIVIVIAIISRTTYACVLFIQAKVHKYNIIHYYKNTYSYYVCVPLLQSYDRYFAE